MSPTMTAPAPVPTERALLDQRARELAEALERAQRSEAQSSLSFRVGQELAEVHVALERLDAIEAEAAKEAATRAREIAYDSALAEHRAAKAELDEVVLQFRTMPDHIRQLEQKFALSLRILNECRDAMEAN